MTLSVILIPVYREKDLFFRLEKYLTEDSSVVSLPQNDPECHPEFSEGSTWILTKTSSPDLIAIKLTKSIQSSWSRFIGRRIFSLRLEKYLAEDSSIVSLPQNDSECHPEFSKGSSPGSGVAFMKINLPVIMSYLTHNFDKTLQNIAL